MPEKRAKTETAQKYDDGDEEQCTISELHDILDTCKDHEHTINVGGQNDLVDWSVGSLLS